jgi:hypothetical protein
VYKNEAIFVMHTDLRILGRFPILIQDLLVLLASATDEELARTWAFCPNHDRKLDRRFYVGFNSAHHVLWRVQNSCSNYSDCGTVDQQGRPRLPTRTTFPVPERWQ